MKKIIVLMLALLMTLTYSTASFAESDEKVTLVVAGGWPEFPALDVVSRAFSERYPECTIVYEYLQNYSDSVATRASGDAPVDLFMTNNIQEGGALLPYAFDLYSTDEIDLSGTYSGLTGNFELRGGTDTPKLYALPLGGEIRGLYVNVTLLKTLGLEVPTDRASLLNCCEVLKENGYTPFHGNPGMFAQLLLYPWICNSIVNADDPAVAYAAVNACGEGVSEMFREQFEFMYMLIEKGYYDYKRAQTEYNLFTDGENEAIARDFLNIMNTDGEFAKVDDIGRVAFMPSIMSLGNDMARVREDYHSEIEYVFIPAPVGEDGGYAYLSPAHGIAICNSSPNIEWAIKFINFLFEPENNKLFAENFNVIPNTADAVSYIGTVFDVPADHVADVGQASFDYIFYDVIWESLTTISKGNNPKYMQDDGSGNVTLYPIDYYMDLAEACFAAAREAMEGANAQ